MKQTDLDKVEALIRQLEAKLPKDAPLTARMLTQTDVDGTVRSAALVLRGELAGEVMEDLMDFLQHILKDIYDDPDTES